MTLTEAQLKIRSTGIGGSELSAVLGESSFAGPLEVFYTKMGDPRAKAFEVNHYQKFGHLTEGAISRLVAQETGLKVLSGEEYASSRYKYLRAIHEVNGTYRNIVYPRILVTPDYITVDPKGRRCLAELKSVGPWSGKNVFSGPTSKKEKYPLSYKTQVNMQMYTLDIRCGMLWVFVSNEKITESFVEPLWQEWNSGPYGEYRVEQWADDYVWRHGELRPYVVPYDEPKAKEHGRYVRDWWAKHIVTGEPDPTWTPKQNFIAFHGKEQVKRTPDSWSPGF